MLCVHDTQPQHQDRAKWHLSLHRSMDAAVHLLFRIITPGSADIEALFSSMPQRRVTSTFLARPQNRSSRTGVAVILASLSVFSRADFLHVFTHSLFLCDGQCYETHTSGFSLQYLFLFLTLRQSVYEIGCFHDMPY